MSEKKMTHRERLQTCLVGGNLDRTPIALWRHFPVDDQHPSTLAAAVAHFQRTYDLDLIKVTPSSSYCLKDWGIQDHWAGNPEGTRDYHGPVIHQPEDWLKLKPLDPRHGALGENLACLRLLADEFSSDTPILPTIFDPMSQAKNLVGKQNLLVHLRQWPDAVHTGLKIITETTLRFLDEALRLKIDGIFLAIQHAQYSQLSTAEFATFCQPYDLQVLQAAQGLWLNLAHLHGEQVMFKEVARYPVAVINWHDRFTPPDLAAAQRSFKGIVCGGLRQWESMVYGDPETVKAEAFDAVRATQGQRFILGTGCVLPVIAPHGNIMAARQAVENY